MLPARQDVGLSSDIQNLFPTILIYDNLQRSQKVEELTEIF